jgi:hypothetical protein
LTNVGNGTVVHDAVQFISTSVSAHGSTDIDMALQAAFEIIRPLARSSSGSHGIVSPMVVLLTDGQPTSGITDPSAIWSNVRRSSGRVPVYALGFGFDLNFNLLQVIAEETGGIARRIYVGVDAAVQLELFFEEVSSPQMMDIHLSYAGTAIDITSTTTHNFARFFNGSELVVAGRVRTGAPTTWELVIEGQTAKDKVTVLTDVVIKVPAVVDVEKPIVAPTQHSNLERLYVYLKIKDLLRRQLIVDNKTQVAEMRNYALKLALDYHLVTPLTSLSIVEQVARRDQHLMDRKRVYGNSQAASVRKSHSYTMSSMAPFDFCHYCFCVRLLSAAVLAFGLVMGHWQLLDM